MFSKCPVQHTRTRPLNVYDKVIWSHSLLTSMSKPFWLLSRSNASISRFAPDTAKWSGVRHSLSSRSTPASCLRSASMVFKYSGKNDPFSNVEVVWHQTIWYDRNMNAFISKTVSDGVQFYWIQWRFYSYHVSQPVVELHMVTMKMVISNIEYKY